MSPDVSPALLPAHYRVASALDWSAWGPVGEPSKRLIGYFVGEGVGTEVIPAALEVLRAVEGAGICSFELRQGGLIGSAALQQQGAVLTEQAVDFCERVFADGGALLCGPGGGRFVYELRREFDLFAKLTPLEPSAALDGIGPVRDHLREQTQIVVVRENSGGLYQGSWQLEQNQQTASHTFSYSRKQVARIVELAAKLAVERSGRLAVVIKPGGAPSISQLWQEEALKICAELLVECRLLEVDNAVFQLIADPGSFDVIVAPNLFGDILGDAGALLMGSRGLSYSGNFGPERRGVYQTAHGAAYDLAGKNRANPIGQIYSLAMLLRESFDMRREAEAIVLAVDDVLRRGLRTFDIAQPEHTVVGTRELANAIAEAVAERLRAPMAAQ